MSPALRLKVAAANLAAVIEKVFPGSAHREWELGLPELIADKLEEERSTWKAFVARELDPNHSEVILRIGDLAELRQAIRTCRKLTYRKAIADLGAAGEEYVALFRSLMSSPWLKWVNFADGEDRYLIENEVHRRLTLVVNPLNPRLADRMAAAVQPLVDATPTGTASPRRGRPRGKKDPLTTQALSLYSSLREKHTHPEAERLVNEKLGMRYGPGSLERMLRNRKRGSNAA